MDIGRSDALTAYSTPALNVLPLEKRAEQQQLIQAVRAVNEAHVFGEYNELQFSRDRDTHVPVMKIVDTRTKEVVRQIPPEYVLRLAADLRTGYE
jgi:flagellar protein FlaG